MFIRVSKGKISLSDYENDFTHDLCSIELVLFNDKNVLSGQIRLSLLRSVKCTEHEVVCFTV